MFSTCLRQNYKYAMSVLSLRVNRRALNVNTIRIFSVLILLIICLINGFANVVWFLKCSFQFMCQNISWRVSIYGLRNSSAQRSTVILPFSVAKQYVSIIVSRFWISLQQICCCEGAVGTTGTWGLLISCKVIGVIALQLLRASASLTARKKWVSILLLCYFGDGGSFFVVVDRWWSIFFLLFC